jgi:hypothetical protein
MTVSQVVDSVKLDAELAALAQRAEARAPSTSSRDAPTFRGGTFSGIFSPHRPGAQSYSNVKYRIVS